MIGFPYSAEKIDFFTVYPFLRLSDKRKVLTHCAVDAGAASDIPQSYCIHVLRTRSTAIKMAARRLPNRSIRQLNSLGADPSSLANLVSARAQQSWKAEQRSRAPRRKKCFRGSPERCCAHRFRLPLSARGPSHVARGTERGAVLLLLPRTALPPEHEGPITF